MNTIRWILLAAGLTIISCGGEHPNEREETAELQPFGSKKQCDQIKTEKNCVADSNCAWEVDPICSAIASDPPVPCKPYCYTLSTKTCTGSGYVCCAACKSGTAQSALDSTCSGADVCCGTCDAADPPPDPGACPDTCPDGQVCDPAADYKCMAVSGTSYYLDPAAPADGNGSFAEPWNSAQQVNSHTFADGDNLFFRVNTTLAIQPGTHDSVKPKLSGTATNQAIIGSYYGENQFGLRPGDKRPIILGTGWKNLGEGLNAPEDPYAALLQRRGTGGYTTIRDLHIKNSYSGGIGIGPPQGTKPSVRGLKILNNVIEFCGRNGIGVARAHESLIEGNYIDGTSLRKHTVASGSTLRSGGAINVVGGHKQDQTNHTIVRNNIITRSDETINVIKGAMYTIVENNIIYDCFLGVYLSNSSHSTARNNLFYQPPYNTSRRKELWNDMKSTGIRIENEYTPEYTPKWIGYNTIHDNYFAGLTQAININNQSLEHLGVEPARHNAIYNNRMVDCDHNFLFRHFAKEWHDNYIYGNYSFTYTSGLKHLNTMSPDGVIWGVEAQRDPSSWELSSTGANKSNYFTKTSGTGFQAISGNASNNAIFDKANLIHTTGWRDLAPGEVTRDWFRLVGE